MSLFKSNKIGFAIGNGTSRLGIDMGRLGEHGSVIGCNAFYRDHNPDALVCVDQRMILEALASGYTGPLYTARMDYQTKRYTLVNHRTKEWIQRYTIDKWAGGPVSVAVALLEFGCWDVILVGHDFNQSPDGTSQNVYLNTPNYDKTGDPARQQGHLITSFHKLDIQFPELQMWCAGPKKLRLRALDGRMNWITHEEMWNALEAD